MKATATALNLTKTYKNAINRLENLLGSNFENAVKMLHNSKSHIVICGMGKSGLVGRKISATFASTGTPSYFLHPGEAIHGDLGIVQPKNIVILISYSGETNEILTLLPALKRLDVKIIGMTGDNSSNLAKNSDIVGADINELSPIKGFDSYNFLAAKLAYKIISYVFEFNKN